MKLPRHLHVDPLNAYPHIEGVQIIQDCGVLPGWILTKPANVDLKEWMEQCYGTLSEMPPESRITDRLEFSYPDDPVLSPMLLIETDEDVFIQYPYTIVSLNGFLTRMD